MADASGCEKYSISESSKEFAENISHNVTIYLLCEDGIADASVEAVMEKYASEKITDIDGVKIDFESGWVHLRKSNTEPIIRVYSESTDEAAANRLAQEVMDVAQALL